METITRYSLEWSVSTERGKVILTFTGGSQRIVDNLGFETFIALAKVLEKGTVKFDSTDHSITNYNNIP